MKKRKKHYIRKDKKEFLFGIWLECDVEDKSTEYLLARISEEFNHEYDLAVDFVTSHDDEYCEFVNKLNQTEQ